MTTRIIFIENRYRTAQWNRLAIALEKQGYQVHILIQNHHFKKFVEKRFRLVIPYPSNRYKLISEITSLKEEELNFVSSADRNINYFEGNTAHYNYYFNYISGVLTDLEPKVVFGESTLFHELLTIVACKRKSIEYFHPSSVRYPSKRFAFFVFDKLEFPNRPEHAFISENEAKVELELLINPSSRPIYMNKFHISFWVRALGLVNSILWFQGGERFNTPSLPIKLKLIYRRRRSIKILNNLTIDKSHLREDKSYFLYPMHMQPESNIDVWGNDNRNQAEVIEFLAKKLIEVDGYLLIKVNPSIKYEIGAELLTFVENSSNVRFLQVNMKMNEALTLVDGVFSVVGTIIMECVARDIPICGLSDTFLTDVVKYKSTSSVRDFINDVDANVVWFPTYEEKISWMNKILKFSHDGVIADGWQMKNWLEDKSNQLRLVSAFKSKLQ